MNITELITKLEEIKNQHGEIKVALQYQDGGGCYNGHTDGIEDFDIEKENNETFLVLA